MSDETAVEFSLEVHDASAGMWADTFKKVVHAPVLELLRLRIDDDPPLGDGDGVISANEEFLLYYEIKNYGTGAATGMTAELSDLDGAFTFFDSTDTYPDLGPFQSGENVSGFHIAESNPAVENFLGI